MSWYDACNDANKFRDRTPATLLSSAALVKQAGNPDHRVPASLLIGTLPTGWGANTLRIAVNERSRQLSSSGLDPSVATQQVNASEFWLYDESARYRSPSQPDSFWGMGTGFQIVWFAVYEDQVIASSGFGLGGTRRLKE